MFAPAQSNPPRPAERCHLGTDKSIHAIFDLQRWMLVNYSTPGSGLPPKMRRRPTTLTAPIGRYRRRQDKQQLWSPHGALPPQLGDIIHLPPNEPHGTQGI